MGDGFFHVSFPLQRLVQGYSDRAFLPEHIDLKTWILVLRGDARVADKHIEKAGNLYIEN